MAIATLEFFHHIPISAAHAGSSKDFYYWGSLVVFMIGEWLALKAGDVVKQPKKIPSALRYWETKAANESSPPVSEPGDPGERQQSVTKPATNIAASPNSTLVAARRERYLSFQRFHDDAKSVFHQFYNNDRRAVEMGHLYSFIVAPGGAIMGRDQTLVDVFFGSRAAGAVKTLVPTLNGFPRVAAKTITEAGAHLKYTRTDAGTVIVTLYPARTESMKQREDFIILARIKNPRALAIGRIRRRHWRAFMSYMHCTSIDGMPTLVDKIRVARIRFMSIMVIGGKAESRGVATASATLARYVLTIGLSGFLLSAINLWQPAGDKVVSQSEHDSINRDLAGAKATIEAQRTDIKLLETRVAALQQLDAGKGLAFSSNRSANAGASPAQ